MAVRKDRKVKFGKHRRHVSLMEKLETIETKIDRLSRQQHDTEWS